MPNIKPLPDSITDMPWWSRQIEYGKPVTTPWGKLPIGASNTPATITLANLTGPFTLPPDARHFLAGNSVCGCKHPDRVLNQERNNNPFSTDYTRPDQPISAEKTDQAAIIKTLHFGPYITGHLLPVAEILIKSDNPMVKSAGEQAQKIGYQKDDLQKQLRTRANDALNKIQAEFDVEVSQVSDEYLRSLFGTIGAICDPRPRDLYEFHATMLEYLADRKYQELFAHIHSNANLYYFLNSTEFGRSVLTEVRNTFPLTGPVTFIPPQQSALLDKIAAFCTPIYGEYFHQICDINLTGKTAIQIVNCLLGNKGIEENLTRSDFGKKIWHELKNYPLYFKTLRSRSVLESMASEIDTYLATLERLDNLTGFQRVFSFFKRKITEIQLRYKYDEIKFESLKPTIILYRDSFFGTLRNIQRCGVDRTLQSLLGKNHPLQKAIVEALNLENLAEEVAPQLLLSSPDCRQFVSSAYALTICDIFTKNISELSNKLYQEIRQVYSSTVDVESTLNQLNFKDKEVQALMLAACNFLPPHLSWQDIQRALSSLSNLYASRHTMPSDGAGRRRDYINNFRQWSGPYSAFMDSDTINQIVNVCFNTWGHNEKINSIYQELSATLRNHLSPNILAENFRRSILIEPHFIRKLNIDKRQSQRIEDEMIGYLFCRGKYSSPELKQARFNLEVASILNLLPNKLAYDLDRINLSTAHYQEKHRSENDNLLTAEHMETLDHIGLLFIESHAMLNNLVVTKDNLEALKILFSRNDRVIKHIDKITHLMNELIYGGGSTIEEFREEVRVFFNRHEVQEIYNMPTKIFNNQLDEIKKLLLTVPLTSVAEFFTTISDLGITLSAESQKKIAEAIDIMSDGEDITLEERTSRVLSSLLHEQFLSGNITTPQKTFYGQSHEFLHELTKKLREDMEKLINTEVERLLGPLCDTSSENSAYIKAACQFISDPEAGKILPGINASFQKSGRGTDPRKLTPDEAVTLRASLHTLLSNGVTDANPDIDAMIGYLRSTRTCQFLHSLAALNYWYNFLRLQRKKYQEAGSDDLRKNIISQIYTRVSEINPHPLLPTVTPDHITSAKDFIQSTDASLSISKTIMYHVTMLNIYLEDIKREHNEVLSLEYRRHCEEIQREYDLAMVIYGNDCIQQEYRARKATEDFLKTCGGLTDERQYKYELREWKGEIYEDIKINILENERLKDEWLNEKLYVICEVTSEVNSRLAGGNQLTVTTEGSPAGFRRQVIMDKNVATTQQRFAVPIRRKDLIEAYKNERYFYDPTKLVKGKITQQLGHMPTTNYAELAEIREFTLQNELGILELTDLLRIKVQGKRDYQVIDILAKNKQGYPLHYPAAYDCAARAREFRDMYFPGFTGRFNDFSPGLNNLLNSLPSATAARGSDFPPPPPAPTAPMATSQAGPSGLLARPIPALLTPMPSAPPQAQDFPAGERAATGAQPSTSARQQPPAFISLLAEGPASPAANARRQIKPGVATPTPPPPQPVIRTHYRVINQRGTLFELAAKNSTQQPRKTLTTQSKPDSFATVMARLKAEQQPASLQDNKIITRGLDQRWANSATAGVNLMPRCSEALLSQTLPEIQTAAAALENFTAVEISSRATGTDYFDCLIISLVLHMKPGFPPDDPYILSLVRYYRSALVIKGWTAPPLNEEQREQYSNIIGYKPVHTPGAMVFKSLASFTLIDAINADLKRDRKLPLRVVVHEMVQLNDTPQPLELTEAYGPPEGREVHILQQGEHFKPLVPRVRISA
ncbi:hypothetical protein [Pantoea sp. B65]|uniref:hypothetical protein n=1 Tax=Pantoea sp. B65 TaxID=2813359 RepID=UPI0039B3FC9D